MPSPFRSVHSFLEQHARERGDKPYAIAAETGYTLNFRRLYEVANQIGHFLAKRGFRANDRVSVLTDNCLSQMVFFHAIQAYGSTVNLVNCEVNAKNVAQIVHDVEAKLILWHHDLPPELQAIAKGAGVENYSFGDTPDEGEFFQLVARESVAPGPRVGGPDDMALINYTSGTTASPKGVCCSHSCYFYMSESTMIGFDIKPHDRVLEYRALTWCSPQILSVTPTLQAGASFVLAKRFSGSHFFDWVRKYEVTISAGVPTAITMLLERPQSVTKADLPTLRYMTTSTAPIAPETFEAFQRRYGVTLVQGCGMSEAGFMFSNDPHAPRRGTVGKPQMNITARFVDDDGNDVPVGSEGELMVEGPQIFEGYLMGRGDVQIRPRTGFRTGDLGNFDAEGFAYLTGRKKDLIIRGGVNIAPLEITTILCEHPDILDAATIGVPDKIYGEAVACFVVPHPGRTLTIEQVIAHLKPRVSEFKMPASVMFLTEIPKTDRQKVSKVGLMAIWERGAK